MNLDTNKNINKNINISLYGFAGIIIVALHIFVLYTNIYAFNLLVCIYIIIYAIIILISFWKNNDCYNSRSFNIIVNFSLYTILLQLFLIGFIIYKLLITKKK
jgi:hypothetical protein